MKNLVSSVFKLLPPSNTGCRYLGCGHRRSQRSWRETELDIFIDFDPAQVSESMLQTDRLLVEAILTG